MKRRIFLKLFGQASAVAVAAPAVANVVKVLPATEAVYVAKPVVAVAGRGIIQGSEARLLQEGIKAIMDIEYRDCTPTDHKAKWIAPNG